MLLKVDDKNLDTIFEESEISAGWCN